MTSPEPYSAADAAAALYVLDMLEADERAEFEQAVSDSVELGQAVGEFEKTAATLAYGASPVPMAADLKERLFQRIAAQPTGARSDLIQLLELPIAKLKQTAAELSWSLVPGKSGVEVAVWKTDEASRETAFFARKVGAGSFPNHYHASGETILVLEGDFIVDERTYYTGERISSPGKTNHRPESLNGCLLLCVSSMDDDILDI